MMQEDGTCTKMRNGPERPDALRRPPGSRIVKALALSCACLAGFRPELWGQRQQVPPRAGAYDVREHYTKTETMIPMRDGVRLFTIVYAPKDRSQHYPILLTRTAYGIPPYGPNEFRNVIGPNMDFTREGYIVAYQDTRGKFRSEGEFIHHRPFLRGPGQVNESTDTYDTIDWLVKSIPNNNGNVGQWGISWGGWEVSQGMRLRLQESRAESIPVVAVSLPRNSQRAALAFPREISCAGSFGTACAPLSARGFLRRLGAGADHLRRPARVAPPRGLHAGWARWGCIRSSALGVSFGGIFRKPAEMPAPPHWLLYAKVRDCARAASAATRAGGTIVNGPMEVPGGDWVAQILDPQGAAFAVHAVKTADSVAPKPAGRAAKPAKAPKPRRHAAKKSTPARVARKAAAKKSTPRASAKRKAVAKTARKKTAKPGRASAPRKAGKRVPSRRR